MAQCEKCGGRLEHAQANSDELEQGLFRFECVDCGRVHAWGKFPTDHYIGEPATPMADPYAHDTDHDYHDQS